MMAGGPLEAGRTFAGEYRVERALSHGGMGHVHVATQLATGRQRALKVMRAELVEDPKLRKRFEQEARVGATIASDHVVEVVDAGVDAATGMPWLAMELLEGESLGELVARTGALPKADAGEVLGHVAHALAAAHKVGVVHRDLKPENVFVAKPRRASESRMVKVLDFGIAKVVAEARHTATAPIGTLLWMAPEQAESDGAIGPATDVWSFGLLAFFAITGRSFWGEDASPATQVKRLVVDAIPSASERAGELGAAERLPAGFDAWFARCVVRAPGSRFASIAAANEELQRLLGTAGLAHAPTQPVTPDVSPLAGTAPAVAAPAQRSGGRAAVMIGVAVAAMGVAAYVEMRAPPTQASVAPGPSASAPAASGSAAAVFKLDDKDTEDHETRWLVPLGDSPRRGGKDPLVTVVEFGDFECPYTRSSEDTAKQILAAYGDDVALVWKDVPMDLHPVAEPAARLARLARAELGEDGFWKAHDLLFSVCAGNDGAGLPGLGQSLGLAPAKVRGAIDGPTPEVIERDITLAMDLNKLGVPGYFFNGRYVPGSHPLERLRPIIDQEMAKARALVASGIARAALYDELQKGARSSAPLIRYDVQIPDERLPTLVGAHAVLDVHQFGDETDFWMGLEQPVVDYVLREYGDRIRLHWHWAPDESNATSMRIATLGRWIFDQNGNDVAWKFHKLVADNAPWPFEWPSHHPRGLAAEALADYARQAGANQLYFAEALNKPVDPADWRNVRGVLKAMTKINPDAASNFLIAEGYGFGSHRRLAKRILDQLLAQKK